MLDQRTVLYGVLLLRVSLGLLFWAHLYGKFFVMPGGVVQWWGNFATNGYPWFVPWYAISAEFVGAILLIPGIYTRWAALYVVPMMIGAAQFWLVRKGFYFTSAGCELPIVWTVLLLVQALLGDGPYALKPSPFPGISSRQEVPA